MKRINKLNVFHCLYLIYRNLFRLPIIILTLTYGITAAAQDSGLNGNWSGNILLQNSQTLHPFNVSFADNKLTGFHSGLSRNAWVENKCFKITQTADGFTISAKVYGDFNLRSESYKISFSGTDTATITWQRQCTMYSGNRKLRNENWQVQGRGFLKKEHAIGSIASR